MIHVVLRQIFPFYYQYVNLPVYTYWTFSVQHHEPVPTFITGKIYIHPQNVHTEWLLVWFIQPQICSHLV